MVGFVGVLGFLGFLFSHELRVDRQATFLRQNLPLVLTEGLLVVGRLCRAAHLFEGELANAHSRVQGHRHAVEVTDFECDGSVETRVYEACRGVHDDAQATQGAATFDTHHEVIGHGDDFLRHAEDKLSRLHNKGFSFWDGDETCTTGKGLWMTRIENGELAVFVELK